MNLNLGNIEQVINNKLVARLSKRVQLQGNEAVYFTNKSEFFAVLADLLPVHYFEKAPVVRVVWELWISIRVTTNSSAVSGGPSTTAVAMQHPLDNPQMSVSSSGSSNGTTIDSFLLKEIAHEFSQRMVLL